MTGHMRLAGILAALAFSFGASSAQASVIDSGYNIQVLSTYSGGFAGELAFSDVGPLGFKGTFALDVADSSEGGAGEYLEFGGALVLANGDGGGGYNGGFIAISTGNRIFGLGRGNYFDIFIFRGIR